MLQSIFKVFFFELLLMILLVSCHDKQTTESEIILEDKYLSSIIQDEHNYSIFNYIDEKLNVMQKIENSRLVYSVFLQFGENENLYKEEMTDGGNSFSGEYFYNTNNIIDSIKFDYKNNTNYIPFDTRYYSYNDQMFLTQITQYTPNNQLWFTYKFEYDSNGNVINKKVYDSKSLWYEYKISYDDKINPYQKLNRWLVRDYTISINNKIHEIVENYYSNTITETKYSYEYDEIGYPIKCKTEITEDDVITSKVEIYKYN